ncbi:hypothetical protein WG66_000341 [Moniliophthora roreri]|nr:hypothetical protein WG66_000341 [Moniliophthora roreri]
MGSSASSSASTTNTLIGYVPYVFVPSATHMSSESGGEIFLRSSSG